MTTPQQAMRNLLNDDRRFKIEAYQFIREALQYAHEHMSGELDSPADDEIAPGKHVTGQQLCEACRRYALDQYGYLARMVLETWGVRSTGDFGDLVYNLIRIEQMRKSDSDDRADFDGVYDFADAFEPKFEVAVADDEIA